MKHSKIFTRPDGSKVEISVTLSASWTAADVQWSVNVSTCTPKKRSWYGVYSGDDYDYRKLDQQGRALISLSIAASSSVLNLPIL